MDPERIFGLLAKWLQILGCFLQALLKFGLKVETPVVIFEKSRRGYLLGKEEIFTNVSKLKG